jgi:glycosyltransferase involved in cell wall biosynthesis
MDKPLVSIVIPAFNAQRTIGLTLKALSAQTYLGPKEIIVVDDGSSDETARLIKSFPNVSYIYQSNQGPAAARNRGFQVSQGTFVFFTDSDCIPEPLWIEKCLEGFIDEKIGVVCGSYGIANPQHLLARCIHAEILYRHYHLMPDFPKAFGSYNFCARREVFSDVKGFNITYRNASGEDNDLSYKILQSGKTIYFARHAVVAHFFPWLVLKYLREQFSHGFWRVQMYRDHPAMALGDDYTFWKDIIEPPVILLILFLFVLALFFTPFFLFLALAFLGLLSITELAFSLLMTKTPLEAIFYAFIMLLRAIARTLGFLTGAFFLLIPKSSQKSFV